MRNPHAGTTWATMLVALLAVTALAGPAAAAPVETQITPIAVYHDAIRPFGMAYDFNGGTIYYTQGDTGDGLVHSARAFSSFSAAELAAFTVVGGVYQLSTSDWEKDSAGAGSFATGGLSAYFAGMAYDASTGQLVMQPSSASNLDSFDVGGGNYNTSYGSSNGNFFLDGLDVDGGDIWFSPDVGAIYKNGTLFKAGGSALPSWLGLGSATTLGYSGVERVGDLIWAVSVQAGGDAGRTRTIVAFDLAGNLVYYDNDGDPVAARWEDLAFDGRYLYAADLRGNADGDGLVGDIYVFDILGDGGSVLNPIPEPGSLALVGAVMAGLWFGHVRRRRRS